MSEIFDEPIAWFAELMKTDDRVMITVASARIDDLLKALLHRVMLHEPGDSDRLFSPDRPLGTFSSRILLSYRLGLIDREFESFLQTVRKLRNDVAHSASPIQLEVAPHLDRICHLYELASKSRLWQDLKSRISMPSKVREDCHKCLGCSLMMAVVNLESAKYRAKPLLTKAVCTFQAVRAEEAATKALQAPTAGPSVSTET